jgi:hypothetical protein
MKSANHRRQRSRQHAAKPRAAAPRPLRRRAPRSADARMEATNAVLELPAQKRAQRSHTTRGALQDCSIGLILPIALAARLSPNRAFRFGQCFKSLALRGVLTPEPLRFKAPGRCSDPGAIRILENRRMVCGGYTYRMGTTGPPHGMRRLHLQEGIRYRKRIC